MRNEEWVNFINNETNPVYELFNIEHINALASYLSWRVKSMGATINNPLTILEVAAGNGRLTHFLQQKLNRLAPGLVKIVATDSSKQKIEPVFPVERLDYKAALQKYHPQIVISSWMPYEVDFTADFRATASVKEYILIGEIDSCGEAWLTWGYSLYSEENASPIAYQADGFERYHLDEISRHQICRVDYWSSPDFTSKSQTVSFRRGS